MLRALFSGVSGLRNHQIRMDVIGNNVSNVNTVAFKSGRVSFKEGFAQLMQPASGGNGQGGTNPMQVGLGSQIGSIDTIFNQGSLETTGLTTDLAIQGDSFFVVSKGANRQYTRAGNFQLDSSGNLVSPTNGAIVQGRMGVNGTLVDTVGNITLPFGQKTAASATTNVTLAGNLDAAAAVFDQGTAQTLDALDPAQRALPQNRNSYKDMSITVYDSLGTKHELKIVMWKTDVNEWDWAVDDAAMAINGNVTETAGTHPITFLPTGEIDDQNGFVPPVLTFTPDSGADDVSLTLDFGTGVNGVTQFGGTHNAVMRDQDGRTTGTLESFSIDRTGTIVGSFSNGTLMTLAQLAIADFNNPAGLERTGDNLYQMSANSGSPVIGYAGDTSSITSGALEMSNVDLAQEFTSMIIAQRGFQANGRIITTSDQMLEELVALKR
jgi:flagellar hook protein FlgE